jgi:hypothetical protein
MNRQTQVSILAVIFLAISFLAGCSSSSTPPPPVIAATSPATSATVTTAYGQLTATVTIGTTPASGVAVIFTAPSSGASGTFANGTNTETDTTDSTGVATSSLFTANYTPGAFGVVAATLPAAASTVDLTNAGGLYSFSLSGYEAGFATPNFYALTGSVLLDGSGNLVTGEQDYNDGIGVQSPEPLPDTIAALNGALALTNGQGTLTLNTNNPALGVAGTETLGVQFVNNNHALIVEFDGAATSSGTLDLQQQPSLPVGNYAVTLLGVNSANEASAIGGVFTATSVAGPPPTSAWTGVFDANIAGTVTTGMLEPNGVASAPDFFGRGTIINSGIATNMNYYAVGPEVMRIIDVDLTDSVLGSAFGQGTATFTNASLGSSAFGFQSSASSGNLYAAAGSIATIPTATPATFAGIADDDEEGFVSSGVGIAGTYSVSNAAGGTTFNGYSNLTMGAGTGVGSVVNLGVYFTDPALNLSDPNNASGGGGALIADLDAALVGTGVLVPQTDTKPADFTGNYAFGAQDFFCNICEFDAVGQGTVTAGVIAASGLISDPDGFVGGGNAAYVGATFAGTPLADAAENTTGRYTLFTTNATPNPLAVVAPTLPNPTEVDFNVVIYQASGTQLFWLDEDTFSIWLGPIQQQGTLSGLAEVRRAVARTRRSHKH